MGYAKDDPGKPQVNLEYVVRQEDGMPLIYKDYPGSIVDVTQCSDMIETIQALGYQDIVAICDRGYISYRTASGRTIWDSKSLTHKGELC